VRGDLVHTSRSLVLPTLALVFILAFVPGEAALAARVYALLLCGAALVLSLSALRRALPRAQPLRRSGGKPAPARRKPPETLARLEQEVLLGAFDQHHRLRPRLRDLARDVLETRRQVSLDVDPAAAREILGETTWELVRPDRPPPRDRQAHGIPLRELAAVVEALERV
jgi:hypothetical protein